jgi:hypothetical protein
MEHLGTVSEEAESLFFKGFFSSGVARSTGQPHTSQATNRIGDMSQRTA